MVLEFARSSLTFRVDWDRMAPKTFSHKPPYALNNARIQLESRLRVTERGSGRVHTFVLGASCKTERVGADVDALADECLRHRIQGLADLQVEIAVHLALPEQRHVIAGRQRQPHFG